MGRVEVRRRDGRRTHRSVRRIGECRALTRHGASASGHLRSGLLASPGAGYRPRSVMPSPLPRTYLVAATQEPFFLENATRWADELRDAGADVMMTERVEGHDDPFRQNE